MDIAITQNPTESARVVADLIDRAVRGRAEEGRAAVLGLATGSSPVATYRELIRRHREEGLSFRGVQVFMLDEYVGLPAGHEQSYHEFIRANFTREVDLDDADVHSPDGAATDVHAEAARYDAAIAASGGVDVQVLGIGTDGHIAFNEPATSLTSRTRIEVLTEQTRRDNARFFAADEEVPRYALTQGLGTIMDARHVVLVAEGAGKARAVQGMVEGPVSAFLPASILQFHPHATVVVDEAAASQLSKADYYRFAWDNQPAGGAL
jgi:glucosamine-6-phosphate deaminase